MNPVFREFRSAPFLKNTYHVSVCRNFEPAVIVMWRLENSRTFLSRHITKFLLHNFSFSCFFTLI